MIFDILFFHLRYRLYQYLFMFFYTGNQSITTEGSPDSILLFISNTYVWSSGIFRQRSIFNSTQYFSSVKQFRKTWQKRYFLLIDLIGLALAVVSLHAIDRKEHSNIMLYKHC